MCGNLCPAAPSVSWLLPRHLTGLATATHPKFTPNPCSPAALDPVPAALVGPGSPCESPRHHFTFFPHWGRTRAPKPESPRSPRSPRLAPCCSPCWRPSTATSHTLLQRKPSQYRARCHARGAHPKPSPSCTGSAAGGAATRGVWFGASPVAIPWQDAEVTCCRQRLWRGCGQHRHEFSRVCGSARPRSLPLSYEEASPP